MTGRVAARRRRSPWWCAFCLLAACGRSAHAQVAPNDHWRSLATTHFRIEFPRELESLARRAGGEAERAWSRLAAELTPPRGPIDIVLSDNQDISNGQATYFPTNRIIVWAHPPIDNTALRFGDDWMQQVITHELTHVFHLDRSRGIWRVGQYVFGRHPSLFPNARSPRWLMEGLAVEFESRLGSGGRLDGSDLYATIDAVAAGDRSLLAPSRLSIATPYWPDGDLAYFGGAWLVDEAARAGGDSAWRRFIERTAAFPIPYMWDWAAKSAFGASFGAIGARAARPAVTPDASPAMTPAYWSAHAPRWRGDTIYYVAELSSETPALYAVHDSDVRRVSRRNSVDAFGISGNRIVSAQLDFTDPYRLYSALYDGDARVSNSERLASPDVRADGEIVAVETRSGSARLVIVDGRGRRLRTFGTQDPDVEWSAPRWSRGGTAIAAIRWTRGGTSAVVVLDTAGRALGEYAAVRAVQSHPSWDAGDRAIYFTSDRSGHSAAYRVRLSGADSGVVEEVAHAALGLYDAEVSPDGTRLAAFRLGTDGPRLVTVAVPATGGAVAASAASTFREGRRDTVVVASGTVHSYSPWRTLAPRYWVPTIGTSAQDNVLPGFYTSGTDVIGRHDISADLAWDLKSGDFYGDADWTYRGLGQPVIDIAASQGWSRFNVFEGQVDVGDVLRRNRVASLMASVTHARVRSSMSVALGPQVEWREFFARPESLATQIDPPLPPTRTYPSLVASAAWSNTSRSALALGPEDGLSLSATARRRWRTDDVSGTAAASLVAVARVYKSLPFPGYARHVLALRASGGWAEPKATSTFGVGGVSGTSLELVPGFTIGDVQRAFFVRGFPVAALEGIRAWAASAEYRAPLPRIGRGIWPLPLFFQRSGLAVFGDAGSAWCPVNAATSGCPDGNVRRQTIAGVGAEWLLDTALEYDSPTRFRLGFAAPVQGRTATGAKSSTVYFTLGLPF